MSPILPVAGRIASMAMKLGYNTNGCAHHDWREAIPLLAEIGYRSVAVTVDHHCLNPFAPGVDAEIAAMKVLLQRHGMSSVIETGARFLLDPRVKHEPTLVSEPAAVPKRMQFLKSCIDIARGLESDAVSFWSGVLHRDAPREDVLEQLAACCRELADYAGTHAPQVKLAFEPEPGMFIESFAQYAELLARVGAPQFGLTIGLTIDIGHVHCVEDGHIADYLHEWKDRLFNMHIEDMHKGVHEHLRFGEGTIDFPPVIAALEDIGYTGGVHVELSRHSHMAPRVMRESFEYLSRIMK